jgi:hypothetical protein
MNLLRPVELGMEQSLLLGHLSVQTTERYLGLEQDIAVAVNDVIGWQKLRIDGNASMRM